MINLILLLIGLGLVVLGADWLVNGASSIARRAGISEFVIGLTIVGFGTSCPELVVSLTGAIEGNSDISVGNVVGSNIFNALFILGLTALVLPVGMTDKNRRIGYTHYPCRYHFAGRARNNRFYVRTRHFAMGRGRDASGVLRIPFLLFQIRFKRRVVRDATGDSVFP